MIEDNEDDIVLTLRAFRKQNIANEIVVAKDGAEALDLVMGVDGSPPLRPALILLDIKLPKVSGLEVLRQIKENEQTKALTVVMLTTSNQEEDIAECYTRGANSYIQKPVDFERFTEAIGLLTVYWLVLNEPNP